MSSRAAAFVLWLVLLLLVPLPYWGVEAGREPALRLATFAAATLAAAVAEPSAIGWLVAALFAVQAAAWFFLLRRAAGRLTGGAVTPRGRAALVGVVAAVLAAVCSWPVYRTPFSRAGASASLWSVYF